MKVRGISKREKHPEALTAHEKRKNKTNGKVIGEKVKMPDKQNKSLAYVSSSYTEGVLCRGGGWIQLR